MFNPNLMKKAVDSRGLGSEFWKPTTKRHVIRVLPPKNSELELPWVLAVKHYKLPLASSGLICGRKYDPAKSKLFGEGSCPVCELIAKLYKSGKKEDIALARLIKASPYWYINILDKSDKTVNPKTLKPKVYRFAKNIKIELENAFIVKKDKSGKIVEEKDMVDLSEDEVKTEILDITDLKKGYSLLLTQTMKTIPNDDGTTTTYPSYAITRASNPSEVIDAQRIMKESKDICQYIQEKPDFEALKKNAKILAGESLDEEDITAPENEDEVSFDSSNVEEYKVDDNDLA